jgi:hypothetical protein
MVMILTTMVPASMTSTLSESMIVLRRWAIVRTVQFLNFLRMVSCTKVSVLQQSVHCCLLLVRSLHSALVRVNEELLERKVAALV